MTTSDNIYSSSLMTNYYVYKTIQKCSCGSCKHSLLSQHVYVRYRKRNGEYGSLPLREIINRYMDHFAMLEPEAHSLLPQLPVYIKEKVLEVQWCEDCLPDFIGTSNTRAQIALVPNPHKVVAGPIESPNATPRKRSRSIKPKKPAVNMNDKSLSELLNLKL